MISEWTFAMSDGSEARIWVDGYMVCVSVPCAKMSSLEACMLGMGLQQASKSVAERRARKELKR